MKKAIIAVLFVGILAGSILGVGYLLHLKENREPSVTVTETESIKYKVPETMPEVVVETTSTGDEFYSETEIASVFGEDIQQLCTQAFGGYVYALQEPCTILEEIGYEYFVAFDTDEETFVVDDNYVEFNIYLPGARGRFNISKEGSAYTTTFVILKDGEHETTPFLEEG